MLNSPDLSPEMRTAVQLRLNKVKMVLGVQRVLAETARAELQAGSDDFAAALSAALQRLKQVQASKRDTKGFGK